MYLRKHLFVIIAASMITATASMSFHSKKIDLGDAVTLIGQNYISELSQLDSSLREYPKYFFDSTQTVRVDKYKDLVWQFKKLEWLFIYLHPDQAYKTFLRPFQFQKRDSFKTIFPDNWLFNGPLGLASDSAVHATPAGGIENRKKNLRLFVSVFIKAIEETKYNQDINSLNPIDIFDALRLQLMKISTVDLGNADFTLLQRMGMHSLRAVFSSWSENVKILLDKLPPSEQPLKYKFSQSLHSANSLLIEQKNRYKEFDRMQFLTIYLLPMSNYLFELRKALGIDVKNKFAAVRPDARNLFEADVFNVDFFTPSEAAFLTLKKAELGKLLFFDPILSDNNKRACASCHKPELAFTDGRQKSLSFEPGDLPRNAPTVINSAFQKKLFWDLRAASLEDQLDSVINNENELHSSFERVINRINSSKEYVNLFHEAFPETKGTGIQREYVKIAIACYERTLIGLNSRFDQYMRGHKSSLTEDEISGFNLFMGKALCGNCHIPPLFNGTIPPYYEITDHRSLGVPVKDTMEVMQLDTDTGTAKTFQNSLFRFSFKIPTVRNAELTAPYMHNGVYKTLEQVINFYNHAVGDKFIRESKTEREKMPYPFFTILPDTLGLDEKEKTQIVAFLKSLTDTTAVGNVPKYLPRLGGKYSALNRRKIGGEY
jgi:cytochrome c peroxidase